MVGHTRFTMATDNKIYVCARPIPWQRGSGKGVSEGRQRRTRPEAVSGPRQCSNA